MGKAKSNLGSAKHCLCINLSCGLSSKKKAVDYATKAIFYEVESANIFLQNKIPLGKEKLDGFATATEFKTKALNDLRFYIELRFCILGGQKIQFIQKAVEIKKNGFKEGRLGAIRFCIKAFWVIYSSNTAIILKTTFKEKKVISEQ